MFYIAKLATLTSSTERPNILHTAAIIVSTSPQNSCIIHTTLDTIWTDSLWSICNVWPALQARSQLCHAQQHEFYHPYILIHYVYKEMCTFSAIFCHACHRMPNKVAVYIHHMVQIKLSQFKTTVWMSMSVIPTIQQSISHEGVFFQAGSHLGNVL